MLGNVEELYFLLG